MTGVQTCLLWLTMLATMSCCQKKRKKEKNDLIKTVISY